MHQIRSKSVASIAVFSLAALLPAARASRLPDVPDAAAQTALSPAETALHVLNRIGFGPRPGDVQRVLSMGVARYVDQQLHPERIPDAAVEGRLAAFPTLSMTAGDLWDAYEIPLQQARRQRKAALGNGASPGDETDANRAALVSLRAAIPPEKRPRRILEELTAARILRAAESQRQLNEVLVDFWMNHFNVYANKGLDRILVPSFERDVVRPRIWGRFEDLLLATARSPAMLFYLDNARSVADPAHRGSTARGRRGPLSLPRMKDAAPGAPTGINENYARELMELHTLGVDGGYTQRDVTELARVLTGWSIDRRREGAFVFRAALHDVSRKTVLGRDFPPGGGIEEGEAALRLLARQPATARHIATALCRRLLSDDPPGALVERVARRFLATAGDLRETVREILSSPEFLDPGYFRAKVKSPFEYAVSAVRAVGASTDGRAIGREIAQMGEPLYLCQPPTGYSDQARAWVSSGSLLARLNFALALTAGGLPGTSADVAGLAGSDPDPQGCGTVETLADALLGGDLSPETRRVIEQGLGARPSPARIAGLILGSPEFQRQ